MHMRVCVNVSDENWEKELKRRNSIPEPSVGFARSFSSSPFEVRTENKEQNLILMMMMVLYPRVCVVLQETFHTKGLMKKSLPMNPKGGQDGSLIYLLFQAAAAHFPCSPFPEFFQNEIS